MQSHEEGWKQPQEITPAAKKTTLSPMLVGFAVFAALALTFVLQNRDRTKINFLFLHYQGRQWFNIVLALALGVVLDRLFALWWRRRKRDHKA